MRFFAIPLYGVILRYYLMMAVVIIAGFSGLYFLALLALPIFLSAFLGVSFKPAPGARVVELPLPITATAGKAA
ncbi:MAG: hypothetical protein WA952_08255 [Lewinella sp.]